MRFKTLFLILFAAFAQTTYGQKTIETEINFSKAYSFYELKQYDSSLWYFNELKKVITKEDTLFRDVAFGITASLYFRELAAKNAEDWKKTETLANDFLNTVEEYKDVLPAGLLEKKYFVWKDLVLVNFGTGKKEEAKKYQDILYAAYKNKELPKGIDQYYNFQKFIWKGLNVWAYEWYPNLGDKETEGSFSKHVYYIYSRNETGQDKEQLFRLHTIKVHKSGDSNMPDYVLTYKKSDKEGSGEASRTLWDYTFKNPIDYNELHKAVMAFLEKNESDIMKLANQ